MSSAAPLLRALLARALPCLLAALLGLGVASEPWDYHEHGPSKWSMDFPQCGGGQQSPIELSRWRSIWQWPWQPYYGDYQVEMFNYGSATDGVFSNNGHSLNLALNYSDHEKTPRLVLTVNGSASTFFLTGLHFHWPSEHFINGRQYPMEMHMVHADADGHNAVIGYVFNRCARARPGLTLAARLARELRRPGKMANVQAFAPLRVLPIAAQQCDVFTYIGSLTTPPCTEGVRWLVYEDPQCVEGWQMEAFESLLNAHDLPMKGNNRPLQPRHGRQVDYLSCGDYRRLPAPLLVAFPAP